MTQNFLSGILDAVRPRPDTSVNFVLASDNLRSSRYGRRGYPRILRLFSRAELTERGRSPALIPSFHGYPSFFEHDVPATEAVQEVPTALVFEKLRGRSR